MPKILMRGDFLSPKLRAQCKAQYVHRFTRDHVPQWSRQPMPNGQAYQVQFASDEEWLDRSLFPVIVRDPAKDSAIRLAAKGDCRSYPTWPDGVPEGAYRAHAVPYNEFYDGTYIMEPDVEPDQPAPECPLRAAVAELLDNRSEDYLHAERNEQ